MKIMRSFIAASSAILALFACTDTSKYLTSDNVLRFGTEEFQAFADTAPISLAQAWQIKAKTEAEKGEFNFAPRYLFFAYDQYYLFTRKNILEILRKDGVIDMSSELLVDSQTGNAKYMGGGSILTRDKLHLYYSDVHSESDETLSKIHFEAINASQARRGEPPLAWETFVTYLTKPKHLPPEPTPES